MRVEHRVQIQLRHLAETCKSALEDFMEEVGSERGLEIMEGFSSQLQVLQKAGDPGADPVKLKEMIQVACCVYAWSLALRHHIEETERLEDIQELIQLRHKTKELEAEVEAMKKSVLPQGWQGLPPSKKGE